MHSLVLDTNVVVSALRGGRLNRLLDLWREHAFRLCVSDGILAEYAEVLARFAFAEPALTDFRVRLENPRFACRVSPAEAIHAVPSDPDDDVFLACAVAAQADLIVSGDRHLLDLGSFRGIRIVTPAEALEILGT